jgi:hypothetical protein
MVEVCTGRESKMILTDSDTETRFSDFQEYGLTDSEIDTTHWAMVCDECAKSHHLLDSYLAVGEGDGVCGVEGCQNKAVHAYDFLAREFQD